MFHFLLFTPCDRCFVSSIRKYQSRGIGFGWWCRPDAEKLLDFSRLFAAAFAGKWREKKKTSWLVGPAGGRFPRIHCDAFHTITPGERKQEQNSFVHSFISVCCNQPPPVSSFIYLFIYSSSFVAAACLIRNRVSPRPLCPNYDVKRVTGG